MKTEEYAMRIAEKGAELATEIIKNGESKTDTKAMLMAVGVSMIEVAKPTEEDKIKITLLIANM